MTGYVRERWVSAAIHAAAGPELEACYRACAPVMPGSGVITPGFGLPNTYVIHIVIASHLSDPVTTTIFEDALEAIMALAKEHHVVSISMPAVGAGFHKIPPTLVDELTERVLACHVKSGTSFLWVRICVTNDDLKAVFLKELEKQKGLGWGRPLMPRTRQH